MSRACFREQYLVARFNQIERIRDLASLACRRRRPSSAAKRDFGEEDVVRIKQRRARAARGDAAEGEERGPAIC